MDVCVYGHPAKGHRTKYMCVCACVDSCACTGIAQYNTPTALCVVMYEQKVLNIKCSICLHSLDSVVAAFNKQTLRIVSYLLTFTANLRIFDARYQLSTVFSTSLLPGNR